MELELYRVLEQKGMGVFHRETELIAERQALGIEVDTSESDPLDPGGCFSMPHKKDRVIGGYSTKDPEVGKRDVLDSPNYREAGRPPNLALR